MTTTYLRFETPLGSMLAIEGGGALEALDFSDAKYVRAIVPGWREDARSPLLRDCGRQVNEYLAGRLRRFELPLAPRGTGFQRRVWEAIARIPYGETLTYAELAARAGAPGSARAAGAATGRNPLALVVPCHRVVGSGGSLTGYAGGLARKARLIAMEGAREEALA